MNPSEPLFDFASYEDVTTADVRITDPTGKPTSMIVTLAGPEHPDRKRVEFARARRTRAQFAKTGKLPVSDPEDDDAEAVDTLVACTLGWTGAAVPYSKEAARSLYSDPKRRWLREKVQTALNEREVFTRTSAPS